MPHRNAVPEIPAHLQPFIVDQNPELYTPMDHASWRFIMRVSQAFFAKNAHPAYLRGLELTGIEVERIPLVREMDAKLQRFGWRAVPVSGFIPPAVFMEFQSLGILPIACEMRTLDHLAYTPAPDIVHEAAGHAPIISDPEYSDYLRAYGEVSRKAIFSSQDLEVYEAIRSLSDIKEDPTSTPERIADAQRALDTAIAGVDFISEAALLARMNWWTVEYGLIGTVESPKIFGAGLLSSVGESQHCLGPEIRKIPFSLACVDTEYDITRPQPQLYVTPDFASLTRALEEFAETMAFRIGGIAAMEKAKHAATAVTVELDTGLQLSGLVEELLITEDRPRKQPDEEKTQKTSSAPAIEYFRLKGPSQIAYRDRQLEGHGPSFHSHGYGTPLGPVEGLERLEKDRPGELAFASGIRLRGTPTAFLERDGKLLLISFRDCTVWRADRIFFDPAWGSFDLALGQTVRSVFGGFADRASYVRETGGPRVVRNRPKCNLTAENSGLNALYAKVRALREAAAGGTSGPGSDFNKNVVKNAASDLLEIVTALESRHSGDWLLPLELIELNRRFGWNAPWENPLLERLGKIATHDAQKGRLIARGLELL